MNAEDLQFLTPAPAAPAKPVASSEATLPEILLAVVDGLEQVQDRLDKIEIDLSAMMVLLSNLCVKLDRP